MDGLVRSTDTNRIFIIPHDYGYLCPDWNQYRYDNTKFPPEDTDIKIGTLELVLWLD